MERLTKRNELGSAYIKSAIPQTRVAEKLATYEDLDDQGLLLILPCKFGDPIYRIYKSKYTDPVVNQDKYYIEKEKFTSETLWLIRMFGDIVFTDSKSALKRLKELNHDD